ncbi:carboxylate--amine ligase/circularly permuted type 2 ATP-grasp protein [Actinomycetospora termitidis]|uniref:Putative glutamate--cysteine ligase 2 n=1 Tax=Actinomycetospora termitidis TaxID=3053470 RepID=A0ABT7MH23_9PSEU|nr:carboxylate--amine ligase/circularly permuted type 2 ATP-grasp protein [Actinomycetospora sp. Odt1-22]MDL5159950.1 carboxylate--amine ligase/circularly permuted type 2 ATP-grasp protein [Actinomycetospora sp. Odt1-22]
MAEELAGPGGVVLGVEEEFHLVDLESRNAVPRVPEMLDELAALDADAFAAELKPSIIETNSDPTSSLADLRTDLLRLRRMLSSMAETRGLGVVGAGSVPLVDGSALGITPSPRYERMRDEYQMLAFEQQICGTQVHVDVPDRDAAVAVMQHSAPWLPILLAMSASSPFWQSEDTGYASSRTLAWHRWPTAGPPAPLRDAADYDALIDDLLRSGTMSDPGMVYFDMRPSAHQKTVELRICDASPTVDGVVLIAGLARALVTHGVRAHVEGRPQPQYRPELLRAASWRAARSGMEGDLVDVTGRELVPPSRAVRLLLDHLRDDLEETGDWDEVSELALESLARGSSAARQRQRFGRTGSLESVVDMLVAETRGEVEVETEVPVPEAVAPVLLGAYHPPSYDEAVDHDGHVRATYAWMVSALERIGPGGLLSHEKSRDAEQRARSMFFPQPDDPERLFPLDLIPRLITAHDWEGLSAGLVQRARTLEALLQDLHGERACLRDGILPREALRWLPEPTDASSLIPAGATRALISGLDVVCDGEGRWKVLEDNLRIPSGIAYAMADRRVVRSVLPELQAPEGVVDSDEGPAMLRDALLSCAPPAAGDDPGLVVLTEGPHDSAYFEHAMLAEEMGVPLLEPSGIRITDDGTITVAVTGQRIDVAYRRIDEEKLFAAPDADGRTLRDPLQAAVRENRFALLNTPGNGLVDDKAVYPYIHPLTEYYFGEKPLLDDVTTYFCADPDQLAHVLDNLSTLVLKPVDGYGGAGIVIGRDASAHELEAAAADLRAHPSSYVAQETVEISTHPTFTGTDLAPRVVDLRAFVVLGDSPGVLPTPLTRVAPAGSLVVNSSRGGGSKDTWLLR